MKNKAIIKSKNYVILKFKKNVTLKKKHNKNMSWFYAHKHFLIKDR